MGDLEPLGSARNLLLLQLGPQGWLLDLHSFWGGLGLSVLWKERLPWWHLGKAPKGDGGGGTRWKWEVREAPGRRVRGKAGPPPCSSTSKQPVGTPAFLGLKSTAGGGWPVPFGPLHHPPTPAHPGICHVSRRRSPCCFSRPQSFFLPQSKFVLLVDLNTYP